MKNILIFIAIIFASCAGTNNPKAEYDYFYFSETAFKYTQSRINSGVRPSPNFTKVDGVYFTLWCPGKPCDGIGDYKKVYPDTKLVKVLPLNAGRVTIHY